MNIPPWLIFHVPHSSVLIPEDVRGQLLLDDAELSTELLRMTDHFTKEIFTSGIPSGQVICAPVSRLVVDMERFEDDREEPMAPRGMGVVYEKTSQLQPLRHRVTPDQRHALVEKYYLPHHSALTVAVDRCLEKYEQCLIIDCHSFSSIPLPYEFANEKEARPDICIGTDENHTSNALEKRFIEAYASYGWSVQVNNPFKGALVPLKHYKNDFRVSAVMVELNRSIYMDELTGKAINITDISNKVMSANFKAIDKFSN